MAWRMVNWAYTGNAPKEPVALSASACADDQGVWYPIIPKGLYEDPAKRIAFEMTASMLEPLIASFNAGLPGQQGIPIDETQQPPPASDPNLSHKLHDKCFGYITNLDLRDDGLWGLFKATKAGMRAIDEDGLVYISPHFVVGDVPHPQYGVTNIIEAGALVSRPLFGNQPGFKIAAGMSTLAASDTPDEHATQLEGGAPMTPDQEQALQAKIDELTAALATKDEELVAKGTEIEGLQAQITERDEKITGLETAQTEAGAALEEAVARITTLEQSVADAAREAQVKGIVDELQSKVFKRDGSDGEEILEQLSPDAVRVAAAQKSNPGDPEASAAFHAHLDAHDGMLQRIVVSEKPALRPVTAAMGGDAGLTDEQKVEALPAEDATRVRGIMARESCGYEEARRRLYEEHRPL